MLVTTNGLAQLILMRGWLNTPLHHTQGYPFNMKLSWKNLLWFIVSLFLDPQIIELFFFIDIL